MTSGLTTLPSLHHCEDDFRLSMDFDLLQGKNKNRTNFVVVGYWLTR